MNQIENKIKEIEAKIANLIIKINELEEKCKNMNQNQNQDQIQIEKSDKIVVKDNKTPEELERLKIELEKLKKQ